MHRIGAAENVLEFWRLRVSALAVPVVEFPTAVVVDHEHREIDVLDRVDAPDHLEGQCPDVPSPILGLHEHVNDGPDACQLLDAVEIVDRLLDGLRGRPPLGREPEPPDFYQPAVFVVCMRLQQGLPPLGAQGGGELLAKDHAVQPDDVRREPQPQPPPPAGSGRGPELPDNVLVAEGCRCSLAAGVVVRNGTSRQGISGVVRARRWPRRSRFRRRDQRTPLPCSQDLGSGAEALGRQKGVQIKDGQNQNEDCQQNGLHGEW